MHDRIHTGARTRVAAAAFAALGLLAACGDSESGTGGGSISDGGSDGVLPEAQPAPDVSVFTEGTFDELPIPPRADPVGERSEIEDVVARSYLVRDLPADAVIAFYDEVLTEWEKVDLDDVGTAGRADYVRNGRGLRVTAQPAPAAGDGEPVVQLSLQMGPIDELFVESVDEPTDETTEES